MIADYGGGMAPEHDVLASSFGAEAALYAQHRPDYAPAAIDWALETAPGRRILDLGAGTGKLTAALLARGGEVVAVEPDARMRNELHRALPDVRALAGSAEDIPLPDGAVDVVVAGNALHWFDMERAGPEIARVLAPGGALAGLWNLFDTRVDWVGGLARIVGAEAIGPRDTPVGWPAATANLLAPGWPGLGHFDALASARFTHGQRRTADALVATLATKAAMVLLPRAERFERLERVAAYLADQPETAADEFVLPMLTAVLRVRRI